MSINKNLNISRMRESSRPKRSCTLTKVHYVSPPMSPTRNPRRNKVIKKPKMIITKRSNLVRERYSLRNRKQKNYAEEYQSELEEDFSEEIEEDLPADKEVFASSRTRSKNASGITRSLRSNRNLDNFVDDDLQIISVKKAPSRTNNSHNTSLESIETNNVKGNEHDDKRYSLRDRKKVTYNETVLINAVHLRQKQVINNRQRDRQRSKAKQNNHGYYTRGNRTSFKKYFSSSMSKIYQTRNRNRNGYKSESKARSMYNLRNRNDGSIKSIYNLRKRDQNSLNRLRIYSTKNFTVDLKASKFDPLKIKKSNASEEAEPESKELPKKFTYLPLNLPEIISTRAHLDFPAELMPAQSKLAAQGPQYISGISNQLQTIKESILLPTLYPELNRAFSLKQNKGILFYGSPGTGKTLTARMLVNECSHIQSPIAFFHFSASDILSKWVGKSESKIKHLFETALLWQPSVIFIDEIDGLTPIRNSTDRHGASLVGTLLSQMDGLADMGKVVVIGATNRVHSIDPALRRSGRFEAELHFSPPNFNTRLDIITNTTISWPYPPTLSMLKDLSALTTGFSGADLVSLCTGASQAALYRHYPEIGQRDVHFNVDSDQLEIKWEDFMVSLNNIKATLNHQFDVEPKPLAEPLSLIFDSKVTNLLNRINSMYGQKIDALPIHKVSLFLLKGDCPIAIHHILASILYQLDDVQVFNFALNNMPGLDDGSDLKALQSLLRNMVKQDKRSLLIIKNIDNLLSSCSEEVILHLKQFLQEPKRNQQISFLFCATQITQDIEYILDNLDVNLLNVEAPSHEEMNLLVQKYGEVVQQVISNFELENASENSSIEIEVEMEEYDKNPRPPLLKWDDLLNMNYQSKSDSPEPNETMNDLANLIFPKSPTITPNFETFPSDLQWHY